VLDAAILQQDGNVPPPPGAANDRDRKMLIAKHRHLCGRAARRFLRPGLERADLEQVAMLGLIKASVRYDPRREAPFGAYAWLMIRSELGHHVRAQEYLVRPPRRLRELERRYAATWESLSARLEREPHVRELASSLTTSPRALGELQVLHYRDNRLPLQRGAPETQTSLDDRLALKEALRSLSTLERRIVFGLYWLESSAAGIGRRLGLSPRSVCDIHRTALNRLRTFLGADFDTAQ
jgi:RNA polymerase sigma-B factor